MTARAGFPAGEPLAALLLRLSRREISAEQLARDRLERVASLEPSIHAFAHLDPASVLAQARELDRGAVRGPLHGLPIGIKDVIDTRDAPTEYGSPIYKGHRPAADASCVAILRNLGGLVFGKTVTTEFACLPPGPTANPRNPAHTPGGSSSGSAAAVACGMLPAAFGTQTSGSVIRPAAFCGVAGYKPTYGTLPRVGVKMISDTLDTVGMLAPCVADAALVVATLSGREALRVPEKPPAPKLALCLTPQWPLAEAETRKLFEELPSRSSRAGNPLPALSLPSLFDGLTDTQGLLWDYELARCLADEYRNHRDLIREPLRGQLELGWKVPPRLYDAAKEMTRACRRAFGEAIGGYDALIVPSAPGEAPLGLAATGNPVFNRMWTLLHVPAVHVPLGTGPRGLPIGVQLVGRIGDDARVLACASWVEKNLQG